MRIIAISVALCALAISGSGADHPGKAIYDQTCKQCHGSEGKGDRTADKFFQVKIPRLNSTYVQSKSDEELKEIITQGRRKMAPVRMGQPVQQHHLAPESVSDVIGYVRTFKQK